MDEQALQNMGREILTDIKEWRREHPRATYVEIEEEVHKRMMYLEAQLIQEAALESPSREWGRGSKLASKGLACIGNAAMSIPCSHYAMLSVMTVGGKCGKKRFRNIACSKHFK